MHLRRCSADLLSEHSKHWQPRARHRRAAPPFFIDNPTIDPIAPDDPLVVELTFTPTPGSFSGTLTIRSSDPDETTLAIALSATSG